MITVLGSLNMDLVTQVNKTPAVGQTTLGQGLDLIPGGKGANQAVTIGKLGGSVQMIGKIGNDDYGKRLLESLKKNHVKREHVLYSNESTGLAFIMVNDNGDNSIVVIPGANFDLTKEDLKEQKKSIEASDILVCQLETPLEVVEEALILAKSKDVFTVLNPAPGKVLSQNILKHTDLLTPNESELEIISGIKIDDEKGMIKACEKLISQGVGGIIVTLGEKGALYVSSDGVKTFEAYSVKAIDTTAAGDSFTGAIAYALDTGLGLEEGIRLAMKVGALTVQKKGAQSSLPTLKDVKGFMKG